MNKNQAFSVVKGKIQNRANSLSGFARFLYTGSSSFLFMLVFDA
jgi:hypothetical protein